MKIFARYWPVPKRMSNEEYRRYRWRLFYFVMMWIVVAFAGVYLWNELHVIAKCALVVAGYLFCPTVDILENLLASYDTYLKRGLW